MSAPTIDELLQGIQAMPDQEAKDFIKEMIDKKQWYTGGDICQDCDALERWTGDNGVPTGIQVAHDNTCPWFNGVTR